MRVVRAPLRACFVLQGMIPGRTVAQTGADAFFLILPDILPWPEGKVYEISVKVFLSADEIDTRSFFRRSEEKDGPEAQALRAGPFYALNTQNLFIR